jgi:predicted transcriptional regulator
MTSITFKLPTSLKAMLEQAAKEQDRNISDFIRQHFKEKLGASTPPAPKRTRKTRA